MEGNRIRETFLRFFEEHGHRRVASSSLIPPAESGLLLANAGMNQFIPFFLGQAEPPYDRATSSQKCFRANDIENVGHTARQRPSTEKHGTRGFEDDRPRADGRHRDPDRAHARLQPIRQAALAATIGIPGRTNGISTKAIAAPVSAAIQARRE
jgi:hypothetical protein